MKLRVFCVIIAIGFCQAEYLLEKRSAHLRVIRSTGMGGFLLNSQPYIIANCKANGLSEEAETKLKSDFMNSEECITKKQIFIVSEEEFTGNLVNCSKSLLRQIKNCLKADQKFFPDYMLQLRNSITSFLYRKKNIYIKPDVQSCIKELGESPARDAVKSCIDKAAQEMNANIDFPSSKSEACRTMDKVSACYPKVVRTTCAGSADIDEFVQIYKQALNEPCQA